MATSLDKFVIILDDNKRPEYKAPGKIVGKRAREIKVVLNIQKGFALAIRTPTFIQFIEPDIIITDICKDLVREDPFDYSYALQIIRKEEKNTIHFILRCEVDNTLPDTNTPIVLPNFLVSFNLNEYNTKPSKYVLNKIVKNFQLPLENPELYINQKRIDFTTSNANEIIKQLRSAKNQNVFKCHLTENAFKIMQKRVNPMNELVKTEGDFLERLNFLINFFKPRMEAAGLLAKDNGQYELFFACCRKIFTFHTKFYTSLTSMKIEYSTLISRSFFEMGDGFLINQDFIRQYGNIQKALADIKSNEKLREIEQQVFSQEKISFDQYTGAPFQRPLKYPLLLREIRESTPSSHIDYRFVCIAESQMKFICAQIDSYCDRIKNVLEMIQISNRIEDSDINVASMDRSLKSSYEVKIKAREDWNKKKQAMLYLWSDKILATKKSGIGKNSKETVLFFKKIKNQQFIISPDQEQDTIFFIINIQDSYHVIFESKEKRDDFLTNFRKIRQNLMILKPNQIFAEEIILPSFFKSPMPPIYGVSAATLSDTLIFFTGGTVAFDKEVKCPPLITFDSKSSEFSIHDDVISPSTEMRMAFSSPLKEKSFVSLYLFGGKRCSQVLLYKENHWVSMPGKASFTRVRHSMVSYQDNLVIFGGLNENGKETNELWFYNVTKHTWSKPFIKHKMPSARFDHSAVVFKNSMIIHGGQLNGEKLNDTWIFSFDQNEWAKIKLHKNNAIVPRSGHAAVIINQFMVVFGGEGYNNMPFALNIETLKVIDLQFKGNFIHGMNLFAASAVSNPQNLDEKQVICFGGFINDKAVIINSFTRLYLPESITKPDQLPSEEEIQLEMNESQVKLVKSKSSLLTSSATLFEASIPPIDEDCFK